MSQQTRADQHRINERFTFSSQAVPNDTFQVVRFSGQEGLNVLYKFEITLVSQSSLSFETIDKILAAPARLTILRQDGNHAYFNGYPTLITQAGHFNGWTFYTLVLQPNFWKLTQIVYNRIYLKKNVQGVVEEALTAEKKLHFDYEFKLKGQYPVQEFSMQYNDSVYDFIAWKLERDGVYYYFDQSTEKEKIIFTDSMYIHTVLKDTPTLHYSPTSGLEGLHYEEVIVSFALNQTPLPNNVVVRDYDWMNPNKAVVGTAVISPAGIGDVYFYGDGFTTVDEGNRLATIRAEGMRVGGRYYTGLSAVPTLRPGFIFNLDRHYNSAFNRDYTITEITHEGSQEGYLSSALGVMFTHPTDSLYYRNNFKCIPADMQFRPVRVTQRNKISGVVNAFIDSSSSSVKPELDEYGRYKVVFPQDISGRTSGLASCWIRRTQTHVGVMHGSSFPLSPGVEVLISFLNGDPDRPLIAGAVSNPETGSMDNAATAETSGFVTGGGNSLMFNDQNDKQGLALQTGSRRSGLFMASGSLDASAFLSDYALKFTSTSDTQIAGLSSQLFAGSTNTLYTGGDLAPLYSMPSLLKAITAISDSTMEAAKQNSDTYMGFAIGSASIKSLATLLEVIGEYKLLSHNKQIYGTLISSTEDESYFKQMSPMSGWRIGMFITYFIANLTATCSSATVQYLNTKNAIAYTDEQIQKVKGTPLEEEMKAHNDNIGKKAADVNISTTIIPALISELLPLITLLNSKNVLRLSRDGLGGILIHAPEKNNVAIGASTETRVVADKQIVIRTMPLSSNRLAYDSYKNYLKDYEELIDKDKDRIINHATQVRTIAIEDDKSYSFKNKEMYALNKIIFSNKPDEIKLGIAQNAYTINSDISKVSLMPKKDQVQFADTLIKQSQSNVDINKQYTLREQSKVYSTQTIDEGVFKIENFGTELSLTQTFQSKDAAAAKVTIKRKGDNNNVKNELSLTDTSTCLSYINSDKDYGKLDMGKDTIDMYLANNFKIHITKDDMQITLNSKEPSVALSKISSTDTRVGIVAQNVILNGKKKIKLDSKDIDVGSSNFKPQAITLNAGLKIKISPGLIQIA